LPDIQPGALPSLLTFNLAIGHMRGTLPASWGASPAVLPSLRHLMLHVCFTGGLPAAWAKGFARLVDLNIKRGCEGGDAWSRITQAALLRGTVVPPAPPPPPALDMSLPPEWASGFPKLSALELSTLGRCRTIPHAWLEGGFPSLTEL